MDDEITLSREEQEWLKTPLTGSMLVKKEMRKAVEQARKCITTAEDLRAAIGDEQFRELCPGIAQEADEMREWLVSYEASQSRIADNSTMPCSDNPRRAGLSSRGIGASSFPGRFTRNHRRPASPVRERYAGRRISPAL